LGINDRNLPIDFAMFTVIAELSPFVDAGIWLSSSIIADLPSAVACY